MVTRMHAGGGYTSTSPELRRIVPDERGRTRVKVVYVVLEAQYQSALTKAVQSINTNRSGVSLPFSAHLAEAIMAHPLPDVLCKQSRGP